MRRCIITASVVLGWDARQIITVCLYPSSFPRMERLCGRRKVREGSAYWLMRRTRWMTGNTSPKASTSYKNELIIRKYTLNLLHKIWNMISSAVCHFDAYSWDRFEKLKSFISKQHLASMLPILSEAEQILVEIMFRDKNGVWVFFLLVGWYYMGSVSLYSF